jgi:hypothetical protein
MMLFLRISITNLSLKYEFSKIPEKHENKLKKQTHSFSNHSQFRSASVSQNSRISFDSRVLSGTVDSGLFVNILDKSLN